MRINHNMLAMNTHRQMGVAGGNQAKSMEKLSSGLRINRAGDDAAGLSISEKMRAQIRGLDMASRNSQDGISMIQTSEGALGETQAILQRMRELAVQSANDTNVGVDRGEIQKEMNQLTSEINRIGNTTEFNTQKVLNGGGEVTDIQMNTMQAGSAAGAAKGAADLTATGETVAVFETGAITAPGNDATGKASFEFNGMKVNITFDEAVLVAASAVGAVNSGEKTVELTIGTMTTGPTAGEMATQIKAALDAYKGNASTTELNDFTFADAATGITATGVVGSGARNNGAIVKTTGMTIANTTSAAQLTTAGVTEILAGSKSIPVTSKTSSTAAVAAEWKTGDITNVLANGESGSISFNGVTINITADDGDKSGITGANQVGAKLAIESDVTTTKAAQAQKIVDAFNAVKAEQSSTGSLANFTFSVDGDGIKVTGTEADGAANNDASIARTGDLAITNAAAAQLSAGVTEIRGEYTFEIENAFEKEGATLNIAGKEFTAVASGAKATDGEFNIGTDAKQQAISIAAALNADSHVNARFDAIVDGGKITLKEKALQATGNPLDSGMVVGESNKAVAGQVSFNIDKSVEIGGRYNVGGVNIEVTDDASHKGLADGSAVLFSEDTKQQANNLSNAIASNVKLNENFDVEASSNRITLTQKEGKESMTEAKASTSTSKNESFQATFQVGANSGQGMTIEIGDMRSVALGVSGNEGGAAATAKNGVKAAYVANTNVSNGTDNTAVEFALDVSSHEKAQAAVSVINDAIETVSAQRSDLGAFQNRLEHTIKNLDNTSENLQGAEARIRDVDMAKEMIDLSKQNILQQAAQAMMAQANANPQGVLQLLR